jgi:hypothetical protein
MKSIFLEYIYRVLEQEVYNEDIKYIISRDGQIRKESDGKSQDLQSSEDLTVEDFFNQLQKNITLEQIIKIKMNNVDMPSVASFTLGIFIQAINAMSDQHKVTANSVMSEKLRGFIFKIKSEPAKNFNIKVANALVYLKDLKGKFDVDKFYNLLKSVGNLNKEITEKNVFGTARDSVVNHIQQNFFGDDTIFEDFMKKINSFCDNTVSGNTKEQFINEFTSAKNSGGTWEITMEISPTTGVVGRRRS